MNDTRNLRAARMKEAMERAGLSSGQVAYRMNVSGGAVRGWASGRRAIGVDELVRFAEIVGYPVECFIRSNYELPGDFSLRYELQKLSQSVEHLAEKIGSQPGFTIDSNEEAISYLRKTHNLSQESVDRIRRIIEQE